MAKIQFERRTGVAVVRVNVTDINNSVPEFIGAPYEAYVGESLPEGAFVTQISARDADSINSILEYSIIAGNDEKLFLIDSRSGKVFTSTVLDYEKKTSYDLLVQVSDGINTAVAPLLVNVVDINDQVRRRHGYHCQTLYSPLFSSSVTAILHAPFYSPHQAAASYSNQSSRVNLYDQIHPSRLFFFISFLHSIQ